MIGMRSGVRRTKLVPIRIDRGVGAVLSAAGFLARFASRPKDVGDSESGTADRAAEISLLTHPHTDAVAAFVRWPTAIRRLIVTPLPTPEGKTWATYST